MMHLIMFHGYLPTVQNCITQFYLDNPDITVVSTSLAVRPHTAGSDTYTSMIHYKN